MNARNLRHTGQVGTRIGHTKVSVLQRKAQVPSEFRGRGNTLAHVRLEHVMYECPADLQGEPPSFIQRSVNSNYYNHHSFALNVIGGN